MDEVEVLARLVGEYSPSGAEEPGVREFCRIAVRLGYRARLDAAGNGIAVRGHGPPRIVFLGHIDTVPGRLPTLVRRGRVHGRGSVDAKGPLAAALVGGREFDGPGTLEILAAVGEETDSRGAGHLARRRGIDFAIAGEPNRWDGVGVGYKGCLRVVATFDGPSRHLTSPFPTSADRALAWADAARQAVPPPSGPSAFRSITLKIAGVRTDTGRRDVTHVTVDLRLPPGTSVREALGLLPRPSPRPEIRPVARIEPWEVAAPSPVVAALIASIRAEGGRPTLWRKGGTSDLNVVAPTWACPAAVYGPGDPHLDHTAHESLSIAELRRSVRVLRGAFGRLAASGAA